MSTHQFLTKRPCGMPSAVSMNCLPACTYKEMVVPQISSFVVLTENAPETNRSFIFNGGYRFMPSMMANSTQFGFVIPDDASNIKNCYFNFRLSASRFPPEVMCRNHFAEIQMQWMPLMTSIPSRMQIPDTTDGNVNSSAVIPHTTIRTSLEMHHSHTRKPTSHAGQDCIKPCSQEEEGKDTILLHANVEGVEATENSPEDREMISVERFSEWLLHRKRIWRSRWNIQRYYIQKKEDKEKRFDVARMDAESRSDCAVALDFWSGQGFASFEHWIQHSKHRWRRDYSWNKRKRSQVEREVEKIVSIENDFNVWICARKHQWLFARRKRQKLLMNERISHMESAPVSDIAIPCGKIFNSKHGSYQINPKCMLIDDLLDEEEKQLKDRQHRPPLDLSFVFDSNLGCPDEAIVLILGYLEPTEYGKLMCIRRSWRNSLMDREYVWRQLCPSHWNLPRRPRKSMYEFFSSKLRIETDMRKKQCDEILIQASTILERGDLVQQVEKLVTEAERMFGFDINYTSGIVCERNAIINLAVIARRQKVVRWLIEVKHADIETCDRGHFTPLLNAAWTGDKCLVRLLLLAGADRAKVGFYHYTKPLSSTDFEGLTADGWATQKGFDSIANLIQLGL